MNQMHPRLWGHYEDSFLLKYKSAPTFRNKWRLQVCRNLEADDKSNLSLSNTVTWITKLRAIMFQKTAFFIVLLRVTLRSKYSRYLNTHSSCPPPRYRCPSTWTRESRRRFVYCRWSSNVSCRCLATSWRGAVWWVFSCFIVLTN
jgi:hypothetical protein